MNIKELKEAIKDLPDDLIIITRSHESGYDPSSSCWVTQVREHLNRSWYEWKYEDEHENEHQEYWSFWPVISAFFI